MRPRCLRFTTTAHKSVATKNSSEIAGMWWNAPIVYGSPEAVKKHQQPATDREFHSFFSPLAGGKARRRLKTFAARLIDGSAPKQFTNFRSDQILGFDLSKDGKQLVLSRGTVSNDVVLIADVPEQVAFALAAG